MKLLQLSIINSHFSINYQLPFNNAATVWKVVNVTLQGGTV